mgnify:CR=1 FL=1
MKKNLLKIASLLLVLAMIFSFAACKSDKDNGDSTAPSESSADANNTVADESTPAEASSEDASAESTEIETVTDASGKVIETKPADSGKAPVVTSKGNKTPSSTADILNYYNAATKAAVSGKVGFAKHRETKNEKIEANAVVKQFKSLIYKFMGIGAENAYKETVTKGQWDTDTNKYFLRASTLGTGDVTAASCKQSGSNYIITINIKNGNSYATKGTAPRPATLPSTRAESASATRTRVTMTTREPAASMTLSTKFTAAQRSPRATRAQSLPQPSTPLPVISSSSMSSLISPSTSTSVSASPPLPEHRM